MCVIVALALHVTDWVKPSSVLSGVKLGHA